MFALFPLVPLCFLALTTPTYPQRNPSLSNDAAFLKTVRTQEYGHENVIARISFLPKDQVGLRDRLKALDTETDRLVGIIGGKGVKL